ncbi:ATP-binding protein [Lentzea terrae]|uniref:ATP-binding protein n=1 Tax=Lentzea terrae TaxID=2200761 RepID=UPI000DD4882E|nr:ATP-binding protein [Lentzea terrae]
MSERPEPAPVDDNPFLPMAVATPREFDDATVTIVTPAVAEAVSLVDAFLRPSTRSVGNVIAIVGEYGTGKSHLVGTLLRHARDTSEGDRPRVVLLEARPTTFVDLYRQLIGDELRKEDVSDRVREFYADVIADELSDSPFTTDIADLLRTGQLDPVDVVHRLKLAESRCLDSLRQVLERVTNNAAFGVALTLLLRHDFADAAWEWLTGHQPDQVLVDRGIDTAIATEELALEAMGVLALLYGHRGRRFVVAIDEMNKVVSGNREPTSRAIDMFQRMMEVFAAAQALLVLAGLPEYLDELGSAVRQRIGRIIAVSPLTVENTIEYVKRSQERLGRGQVLDPFTVDTVRYLVKLTDGNARRIIRLCSHLYRRAVDANPHDPARAQVTEAMVREVAREHAGAASADHVRNEIRQVLAGLGLTYERDVWLNPGLDSRADYWVPFGSEAHSGCALVLSESVLDRSDCDALVNRATFLLAAGAQVGVILVVVGLVHADFMPQLNAAFSAEPIVYDQYTFNETLSAVLEQHLGLLADSGDDVSSEMREQFTRLGRQQANTQRMLEQAMKTLTALRSSSDRALSQLQQEMAELTSQASAQPTDQQAPTLRLPPVVLTQFTDARASLDAVDQVDAALRAMFAATESDLVNAVDARVAVRAQLRSPLVFSALGVSTILRMLLDTFQDGVNEWYRTYVPGPTGMPYPGDKNRLGALCLAYDTVYEYIPFFRLEEIDQIAPYLVDGNLAVLVSPPQLAEARELFNGLSRRVHAAVLESVADWR